MLQTANKPIVTPIEVNFVTDVKAAFDCIQSQLCILRKLKTEKF